MAARKEATKRRRRISKREAKSTLLGKAKTLLKDAAQVITGVPFPADARCHHCKKPIKDHPVSFHTTGKPSKHYHEHHQHHHKATKRMGECGKCGKYRPLLNDPWGGPPVCPMCWEPNEDHG